jgi:hypothetical protein
MDEQRPSLAFDADDQLHLAWAIWGERSGIARTTWGGSTWTAPAWVEMEELVEAPTVAADQDAWIFWLSGGKSPAPIGQQQAGEITEPVPDPLTASPAAPVVQDSPNLRVRALIPLVSYSSAEPALHFAHGDSITEGEYHGGIHTPYPIVLQQLLNTNIGPSEVINHGKPGEKARAARARLVQGLQANQPQFAQIMEGTNDITAGYDADQTAFAVELLVRDARATVPGIKVVVGTITPRKDKKRNEEVEVTNYLIRMEKYFINTGTPIADTWQAFYDYGNWEEFYTKKDDPLHPDSRGLAIIANTFYQSMVDAGWFGAQQ